jgi:hypothetical protein
LSCHPTKTCFVIFDSKRYITKVRDIVKKEPIMLGDQVTQPSEAKVYLGDVLAEGSSLAASTEATAMRNMARCRGALYEVRSIMEDFRIQAIGGMAGAWDLWEAGICSSLLANCSTWVKISTDTIKKLNQFQNQYLRLIYSCPPSTPLPALRSQAGMLGVEQRIYLEKINLVAVILHRTDPSNYSRLILEEQILMGWEGLAMEAKELCAMLGLPDVTKKDIGRRDIKEAVMYNNIMCIKKEMEPLQKLDKIRHDDFRQMASYMLEKSLEDSRLEFLWLTDMLDSRTTMSKKYSSPYCPHCAAGQVLGAVESPDHWMSCEAYREYRDGLNPDIVQKDRFVYLRKVLRNRKELEKELEKELDSEIEDSE